MPLEADKSSHSKASAGPVTASEKGGGEMEKVRMRFATFANVVLHYILLQSGIIRELQYWTVFNIEDMYFLL